MLEHLQALDEIRINFDASKAITLNIILAVIMFGVALEIKVDQFKKIANNPRSTFIGVTSQFILLPAATFVICLLFSSFITPTIALGMILVAACPGGNISNFMSNLGRANIALSVTLTAIASMAAIFMTPLNFALWGRFYTKAMTRIDASHLVVPLEIDPGEMFKTVFIILGIPLIVGMFISHRFPETTKKIVKPIKISSIVAFFGIVIVLFALNYDLFIANIRYIFLLVLAHNLLALGTGYTVAGVFRRPVIDRRTISIETGIQNSGLALALLFNPNIFPEEMAIGGMTFIAGWWGIWHILSGLSIAGIFAARPIKEKPIEAVVEA